MVDVATQNQQVPSDTVRGMDVPHNIDKKPSIDVTAVGPTVRITASNLSSNSNGSGVTIKRSDDSRTVNSS